MVQFVPNRIPEWLIGTARLKLPNKRHAIERCLLVTAFVRFPSRVIEWYQVHEIYLEWPTGFPATTVSQRAGIYAGYSTHSLDTLPFLQFGFGLLPSTRNTWQMRRLALLP
jgi:hypothetical protein